MDTEKVTISSSDVATIEASKLLEEDEGPKGPHFFCDAHAARHPEGHPREGEPSGCGERMPTNTFDGTWIDRSDEENFIRKFKRFVPGRWTCLRCKSVYPEPHEGVQKA